MKSTLAMATRKSVFRLASLAIILMAAFASTYAQGGTITIQGQAGTFPTIQSAIDAAPSAGTVIVDGGDHQENLEINTAVQLIGQSNAAINPVAGTPIFVNNPNGNVVINGFIIKVPANQIGVNYDGLLALSTNTGTVLQCVFLGGAIGVQSKEAQMRVVGNQFSGFTSFAVKLQGVTGGAFRKMSISTNLITGNLVSNGTVQQFMSAISVSDASLRADGNQITNVSKGILVSKCTGGITNNLITNVSIGVDLNEAQNFFVEHNTSSVASSFAAVLNAIQIYTNPLRMVKSSAVTVRNNTFTGGNFGIMILQQSQAITVVSNIVRGVIAGHQAPGDGITINLGSSAEIHNNNIENNAGFGLRVFDNTPINATNNWWGAANGPSGAGGGGGDAVSSSVTFFPFLTAPNPNAGV